MTAAERAFDIDRPSRAVRRVSGDRAVGTSNPCEVTTCDVCDTARVLPDRCSCPHRAP